MKPLFPWSTSCSQGITDRIKRESPDSNFLPDALVQGEPIEAKSFGCVSVYLSKRLLPMAKYQSEIYELDQCIFKNSFDNLPFLFWVIFHFLYMGALHYEQGKLTKEELSFGKNKIMEFFIDRGLDYNLVQDFFVEGALQYRKMARDVIGKTD